MTRRTHVLALALALATVVVAGPVTGAVTDAADPGGAIDDGPTSPTGPPAPDDVGSQPDDAAGAADAGDVTGEDLSDDDFRHPSHTIFGPNASNSSSDGDQEAGDGGDDGDAGDVGGGDGGGDGDAAPVVWIAAGFVLAVVGIVAGALYVRDGE